MTELSCTPVVRCSWCTAFFILSHSVSSCLLVTLGPSNMPPPGDVTAAKDGEAGRSLIASTAAGNAVSTPCTESNICRILLPSKPADETSNQADDYQASPLGSCLLSHIAAALAPCTICLVVRTHPAARACLNKCLAGFG